MSQGPGVIQRRVLLLLFGGLALGLSGSPRGYFRILKLIGKEWADINRQSLWRAIRELYRSKFVTETYNADGSITMSLTDRGQRYARTFKLDEMRVQKPKTWDGQWRIVAFDIPEKQKRAREALRFRFHQIGLQELQKSVFVCPYPCDAEVEFLIEFYQVRPYVRKVLAISIDNELHLKQKFGMHRRS